MISSNFPIENQVLYSTVKWCLDVENNGYDLILLQTIRGVWIDTLFVQPQ